MSHGQQEGRGACTSPMLKAEAWEVSTKPRARVAYHGFLIGDGVVLLNDGEHVQGKPATQGDLELVQVREPGKQQRRDEGVRTQKQESVAGVVIVIVRRGVITAGPRGESRHMDRFACLGVRRRRFTRLRRLASAAPASLRRASWAADARGSAAAARGVGMSWSARRLLKTRSRGPECRSDGGRSWSVQAGLEDSF